MQNHPADAPRGRAFDLTAHRYHGTTAPGTLTRIAVAHEPIQRDSSYYIQIGTRRIKQDMQGLTTVIMRCPIAHDPFAHTGLLQWSDQYRTIVPERIHIVERDPFDPAPRSVTQGCIRGMPEIETVTLAQRPGMYSAITRANLQQLQAWAPEFPRGNILETGALYGFFDPANGQLIDNFPVPTPSHFPCVALSIGCDRFLRINGHHMPHMLPSRDITPQKGYAGPALSAWALRELAMLTTVDLAVPLDWYL